MLKANFNKAIVLVNIKHAVFMTEQKARELELRGLQQAFEAKGKPASFVADSSRADTYTLGVLGLMSSYNRIGAVPARLRWKRKLRTCGPLRIRPGGPRSSFQHETSYGRKTR